MTPYTYFIGWSKLNRFYYGSRYAKNCDPSELMITYFTSSKLVHQYLNEHGKPDIVQIRRVFKTVDQARTWEHQVLRRLDVVNSEIWLNRTDNRAIQPMPGSTNPMYGKIGKKHHRYGVKLSDKTKKKIGDKSKQKSITDEFREKMRQIVKGRRHCTETKNKISNALKGRLVSAEHRKNISLHHADVSGKKNPFYGKKHTEEIRNHFSKIRQGKKWVNNPLTKVRKLINCVEIDSMLKLGYQLGKGYW